MLLLLFKLPDPFDTSLGSWLRLLNAKRQLDSLDVVNRATLAFDHTFLEKIAISRSLAVSEPGGHHSALAAYGSKGSAPHYL